MELNEQDVVVGLEWLRWYRKNHATEIQCLEIDALLAYIEQASGDAEACRLSGRGICKDCGQDVVFGPGHKPDCEQALHHAVNEACKLHSPSKEEPHGLPEGPEDDWMKER